jgi:hypothetical protein
MVPLAQGADRQPVREMPAPGQTGGLLCRGEIPPQLAAEAERPDFREQGCPGGTWHDHGGKARRRLIKTRHDSLRDPGEPQQVIFDCHQSDSLSLNLDDPVGAPKEPQAAIGLHLDQIGAQEDAAIRGEGRDDPHPPILRRLHRHSR